MGVVLAAAVCISMTCALSGCDRGKQQRRRGCCLQHPGQRQRLCGRDPAAQSDAGAVGAPYSFGMTLEQIKALETNSIPQPMVQATYIWKEAYGVDIAFDVVSESQTAEYLSTAVAAGTSPDIIPGGNDNFPVFSAKGLVADMDDEKFSKYLDLNDEELGFNKELMAQYNFRAILSGPLWRIRRSIIRSIIRQSLKPRARKHRWNIIWKASGTGRGSWKPRKR